MQACSHADARWGHTSRDHQNNWLWRHTSLGSQLSSFPDNYLQEDVNDFPSHLGHFVLALHGGKWLPERQSCKGRGTPIWE